MTSDTATLDRIAAVDPVHADTMRRQPTTFTTEALPFYKKFKLVKASIRLPHRPLEFRYADDGAQTVYLSGAAEDIYRLNEKEGLQLAESDVPAYVRFFLANVESGRRRLVEKPDQVVWLPATAEDARLKTARAEASAKIRPLGVSSNGGYRVTATVVEARRLLELAMAVGGSGQVTIESSKVLAEDLPVAATL